MVIKQKLNKQIEKIAPTMRKKKIKNEGGKADCRGLAFEVVFAGLVKENSEIQKELNIKKEDIEKILTEADEEFSKYTKNKKIDVIIFLKGKPPIGVSCKCTGATQVSVATHVYDVICRNISLSESEKESLNAFKENGIKKAGLNPKYIKILENMFSEKYLDFMDFCIKGEMRFKKEIQVSYIAMYDRKTEKLYLDKVENYIEIMKRDTTPKGSFNSRMTITRPSKILTTFVFKMKNPMRMKNGV